MFYTREEKRGNISATILTKKLTETWQQNNFESIFQHYSIIFENQVIFENNSWYP